MRVMHLEKGIVCHSPDANADASAFSYGWNWLEFAGWAVYDSAILLQPLGATWGILITLNAALRYSQGACFNFSGNLYRKPLSCWCVWKRTWETT